jgi:hypothetical protein
VKTLLLTALLLGPTVARGQQPLAPPTVPPRGITPPVAAPDSGGLPHGPLHYFFRSLLVPGWGQASLDRKLTGGLFLAFEGVALGMALKAHTELRYLERTGSVRIEDKRNERQDWFVLMAANHLFAALEAFVSANLYDFPGDLRARPLPNGRTGLEFRIPLPR